jgi:hypothetical protein
MRSASCPSCPGRRNSGADASSLSYLPTRGRFEYGATANLIIPAKATPLASPRRKPGSSARSAVKTGYRLSPVSRRVIIPAFTAAITLPSPRPLRGAVARRRACRDGVRCPCGLPDAQRRSGRRRAPPGSTKRPCQELADIWTGATASGLFERGVQSGKRGRK